jgi:SAM-dependent methyltransferase
MADAYREDLAYIHDAGYGSVARSAAPVLLRALRQAGSERGLVIDLGCGSGILAAEIAAAGYEVLGYDISEAMIALARRRVPQARFRVQSLWAADLPPCVAVTAIGECFNYLFDPDNTDKALAQLFRRIRDALCPGGLLLFDVAEPGRVPGPGSQRHSREEEGWAVLVTAEEDRRRKLLTRRITSFRKVGDLYRREQEVHRLRLLRGAALARQLRGLGFRVRLLRGYGEFRFPPGYVALLARKPGHAPTS